MARTIIAGSFTWILFAATAASAMPAPKDADELNALSDIVVDAEVVSVECVGVVEVPGELKQAKLRSTHQVLETHLGEAPETFYIDFFVDLMDVPMAGCAWREPEHWEGERAKLWLSEAAEAGDVYALFSWSGIETLADSAPVAFTDEELANCASDTTPAPGSGGDSTETNQTSAGGGGCSMARTGTPSHLLPIALGLIALLGWRTRRAHG